MTDSVATGKEPLQSDVIHAGATVALGVSAVVTFVPSFFLLWLGRDVHGWQEWAISLVALGLWCVGLGPPLRTVRPAVSTLATALVLLSPLMISPLGGPGWVLVTTTAVAIIVGAVFSMPTWAAIVVTCLIAALDGCVRLSAPPSAAFVDSDLMHGLIGPLLDILTGFGLIMAQREWVRLTRDGDRLTMELRRAEEAERHELSIFTARAAVERRIHETVLNTLSAISMGMPSTSAAAARETCRHDLDQIGRGGAFAEDVHVSVVIEQALASLAGAGLNCGVVIECDPRLSHPIANAVCDAVVEALRNVERHSGQNSATIHISLADYLIIEIRDDGVGFTQISDGRFGTRDAIRAAMAGVGATSLITSGRGQGTTVTLSLPSSALNALANPEPPLLGRLVDGSQRSRIGMLSTSVFLLISSWAIAEQLPFGRLAFVAIITSVIINVVLCFAWNSRARMPLVSFDVAVIVCSFGFVASSAPGCSNVSGISWLISGMSGGGTLLVLTSSRRLAIQLGSILVITLLSLELALAVPASCQIQPLAATFINACYMASIIYVFIWIDRNFDAQRQQAADIWQMILNDQSRLDHQVATRESWGLLGPSARDLLEGVADGSLAVDDPRVRVSAGTIATAIRGRMGLGAAATPGIDSPFNELLTRLSPIAARLRTTIDGDEITQLMRSDPYPPELIAVIEMLMVHCVEAGRLVPEGVSVRALADEEEDELIIIFPSDNLVMTDVLIEDCWVEVLASEHKDGKTRVSVRRPQACRPRA